MREREDVYCIFVAHLTRSVEADYLPWVEAMITIKPQLTEDREKNIKRPGTVLRMLKDYPLHGPGAVSLTVSKARFLRLLPLSTWLSFHARPGHTREGTE